MQYFIRAVKYFFYFATLTTLILLALVLIGAVEGNVEAMIRDGYDAIWKMAIFFVLVAAVYPKFGFVNRQLETSAEWGAMKEAAVKYFNDRDFKVEAEDGNSISFRRRSPIGRLVKMCEDRITLTRTDEGYFLEGLRKDVFLYATGLEHSL